MCWVSSVLLGILCALSLAVCHVIDVPIGQSAMLPCMGDPSSDVEWSFMQTRQDDELPVAKFYNGTVSLEGDFQGRVKTFHKANPKDYSLLIDPVVYNDQGVYRCHDANKLLWSEEVKVHVPSYVSVEVGKSIRLPCHGNIDKQARTDDLDIFWRKDGTMVYKLEKNITTYGPGFEHRTSLSIDQAHHGNLFLDLKSAKFSDEGDYQCLYNTPKESGTPDSVKLIVTGYPPQNRSAKAGGLLSIPLHTTDPVKITFTRTGSGFREVLMADVTKGQATLGEGCRRGCAVVSRNNTLSVGTIAPEDAGVYKVIDSETKNTIGEVSLQVSAADSTAGPVAGIVVGVLLALAGVVGFAVWRRHRSRPSLSVTETRPAHAAMFPLDVIRPNSEPSSPVSHPVPETQPLNSGEKIGEEIDGDL